MKVTLLIPTLNEVDSVRVVMPKIKHEWVDQILIVDGGSTDGTVEYFREQGYEIFFQKEKGYGRAIREALDHARGDIIIEFTPDGNSIPEVIPELVAKIREGYDLVVASRYMPPAVSYDDDFVTAFGNWMFTNIVNFFFFCRLTDVLVAYRAYRKESALQSGVDEAGLGWPCQLSIRFTWRGYRVTEIPADEPPRIAGGRKMKPFRTGLEIVYLILREFFLSRQ